MGPVVGVVAGILWIRFKHRTPPAWVNAAFGSHVLTK